MGVHADLNSSKECCEQQNVDRDVRGVHQASAIATDATTATSAEGLIGPADVPCHKLDSIVWLHNQPETEVYKLLIDYLRLQRTRDFNGKDDASDEDATRQTLFDFLHEAKAILPTWWARRHASACVLLSMRRGSMEWSQLNRHLTAEDVENHYGCKETPKRLTELASLIYGTDLPDQDVSGRLRWKP
jgi:hypothetical protein